MDQSPRLFLSYVMPAQAQKHVTVNETFRRLDALVQLSVRSRTTGAEPVSPLDGDAYILPAGATGATWDNYSQNNIAAYQDGAWVEITSGEGMRAWVADEGKLAAFDGAMWSDISGGGGGGVSETANKFGINTTADVTNRLSVKSDAVLFSHDDVTPGNDDCLIKVNKKAASDTASAIFQTAFSGRAECGLTGDDDFHVKVSANGSSWTDAIFVDKDNGYVGIGGTSAAQVLEVHDGQIGIKDNTPGFWLSETDGSNDAYIVLDGGQLQFQTRGSSYGSYVDRQIAIDLTNGVKIGAPTGSYKGTGTLNAQAVYDDNSLLSCYVFDQALDGSIDAAKWDARVPDRRIETDPEKGGGVRIEVRDHAPMRKFANRIGTVHDPLTLDGYAKHWKEKRHLTAMPNEATFDPEAGLATGEWIQRLVETVEIQAVLIEALNKRLKKLERSSSKARRHNVI